MLNLTVGFHNLDFSKEGYAPATTPVDITADELPGGSITFELGGFSKTPSSYATAPFSLETLFRLSLTEVVIRIDGKDATYSRNLVKKISLVERIITEQALVRQPVEAKEKKWESATSDKALAPCYG